MGGGTVNDEWMLPEDDGWALPEEDEGETQLPGYLKTPGRFGQPIGVVKYNRRKKAWTVEGDPSVTQLIKRLFPGADQARRGRVTFPDHWRYVADLNWIMLRFPLEIAERDTERWQQAIDRARERILRRDAWLTRPGRAEPAPSQFNGELTDFQKEGVSFLLEQGRALLADEMGLGKTVQALAALAIRQQWPVLLVVPPHLVTNWIREAERFLRVESQDHSIPLIHVIRGLTPYTLPPARIYLIHYLLLRGWKKALPAQGFDTVVFDEIQELRHSGTEKYSAASLVSDAAQQVYGLSGTPIYNAGGEIYNVMNILDFHCLGDWEGFTREWCYGYGNDIVAHPDELGDYLRREGLMLRRLKGQVLKELPAKRRIVQAIDWDEHIYQREMKPVYEKLRTLMALGAKADGGQQALLREQIVAGERQATGLSKAPWVSAFVRALLEAGERVLLFAHHHSVFDCYRQQLHVYRPVFITGRETTAQKDTAVERFMAGKTNLCCISLRAASGLNLQAATCTVFGELDWSPAVHSQAEDRAHRMGKEDSLICYYLVCAKGTDQDMQEALGLKVSQFKGLMGEAPEDDRMSDIWEAQRHMDQVIDRLRQARPDGMGTECTEDDVQRTSHS